MDEQSGHLQCASTHGPTQSSDLSNAVEGCKRTGGPKRDWLDTVRKSAKDLS